MEDQEFTLYDGVKVELLKNNTTAYGDLDVQESEWNLIIRDRTICTRTLVNQRNKANLFELFRDAIEQVLGPVRTDWIRRMVNPRPGEIPPWERGPGQYARTPVPSHSFDDEGNANRFEDECKGWLIYDIGTKSWYAWHLNHWEQATTEAMQAARVVGRSVIYEEKFWRKILEEKELAKYHQHAKRAANKRSMDDMLSLAKANMTIDIAEHSDAALMSCKNGIINTMTGDFYELWECDTYRESYPLAYIACEYIEGAKSQIWVEHLLTIMEDNTTEGLSEEERENRKFTLTAYLLRLFGYALYPGNPERIFVFFYGCGRNGKSTTTNVLQDVLGKEAATATISQLNSGNSDRPSPSIAKGLPKHLVIFSEADGNARVSTSGVKEVTGERKTDRFRILYQDNVPIPIRCLPIGTTNEMPQFDGEIGPAMLNRMVTIPFHHVFAAETRGVSEKLSESKDGIFSMMVDELRHYLKDGLRETPQCARATQQELLVGDTLYEFLTSDLEKTDGRRPEDRMTRSELKQHYLSWALAADVDVDTRTVRDEGDQFVKVLTKKETNRLFAAVRVMGFKEGASCGKRYFCAAKRTDPQKRLG